MHRTCGGSKLKITCSQGQCRPWGNQQGKGGDDDLDFLENAIRLEVVSLLKKFFGGGLPPYISNFSSLTILSFGSNQIYGEIPAGIGNLVNLSILSLQDNRISGAIPSSIGKLRKLMKIYNLIVIA
ncbi:hypothetical protein SAY86_001439 [Trapa natans]|uniref:Uncharacterized protein n=1 Tax=Trapa natans TaxID=22666 RepID=A0AAN7RME3_TRANT|nr:hypothetical protein SAY86_001439 [Trapa natans]